MNLEKFIMFSLSCLFLCAINSTIVSFIYQLPFSLNQLFRLLEYISKPISEWTSMILITLHCSILLASFSISGELTNYQQILFCCIMLLIAILYLFLLEIHCFQKKNKYFSSCFTSRINPIHCWHVYILNQVQITVRYSYQLNWIVNNVTLFQLDSQSTFWKQSNSARTLEIT